MERKTLTLIKYALKVFASLCLLSLRAPGVSSLAGILFGVPFSLVLYLFSLELITFKKEKVARYGSWGGAHL